MLLMVKNFHSNPLLQKKIRLQPQVASMEAGVMEIFKATPGKVTHKQILFAIHYYVIFAWFLDCSLKQPPWRLGLEAGVMESHFETSGIIILSI